MADRYIYYIRSCIFQYFIPAGEDREIASTQEGVGGVEEQGISFSVVFQFI